MIETDVRGLLDWYAPQAERTANPDAPLTYYRIGLLSEIGEVCGLLKKSKWHGKTIEDQGWVSELGDCAWYATMYLKQLSVVDSINWNVACKRAQRRYETLDWVDPLVFLMITTWNGKHELDDLEHTSTILGAVFAACDRFGGPRAVLEANVAKLQARFPNGFVTHDQRADLTEE